MRARALTKRRRVVLADDHAVILDGLELMLKEGFDIVARVESGTALLGAVAEHQPDIVVTDVSMPDLNGIVATQRIRERFPDTCVVLLSMHSEAEYVLSALQAGAAGYVLKHAGAAELVKAIRRSMAGQTYIPPSLRHDVHELLRSKPGDETLRLSERQVDLLRLLADGKTAKEIAQALDISRKTVEYHKYRLQDLLGVGTTAELIRQAIGRGLVDP